MVDNPAFEELEKKVRKLEKEAEKSRQVCERLKKAEAYLRAAFNAADDSLMLVDSQGTVLALNEVAARRIGRSIDELVGRDIFDYLPPDSVKSIKTRAADVISAGKPSGFQGIRDKRIYDITIYPVVEDDGKITSLAIYEKDITRQNRSEEILSYFKSAAESSSEAIGMASPEGRYWYRNKVFNDLFGDIGTDPPASIYVDEKVGCEVFRTIMEGTQWKGEVEMYGKDKNVLNIFLRAYPVKDNGKIIGLVGLHEDITESRFVERALKSSEEKWRNILVNTPQIGITLDPQASIVFTNNHFLKLTGWKEDEVTGRDWFDMFIPVHVREEVREIFRTVISQKDPLGFSTYENEIIDKNGKLLNIAWSNVLTKDYRGNVVDVTCLGIDLTERKKAEESLLSEKLLSDDYINSLPGLFYVFDEQRFVKWNSEWNRVTGYSDEELGTMYGMDFFEGESRELIGERMLKVFREGVSEAEAEIITKDGRKIPYYFSGLRKNLNGKDHLIGLGIDITERKRTEKEKKELEAQLQQARKMESIGTLSGGIAHDFNNILGIIIGNTELALDDVPEWNPAHFSLKEIKDAGLRGADIVRQLLSFSRKTEDILRPTGFIAVIKDSLKLVRSMIPANIEIRKNIPETEVTILAEPVQINQVVMNLCINASHAMEETGGILEISVDNVILDEESGNDYADLTKGDYVRVIVRDTGPGIDSELIDRIFDPYFTTKKVGKGSGMGLSVVHGIVKNHNGAIIVDSIQGKGTAFSILFPVVMENPEIKNVSIEELPRGSEKILFVDDEISIVKMAEQLLKRLGYQVETATDPVGALELFKSKSDQFDLVITDMSMPQMTGVKLFEKLREIQKEIPVIICTGYSTQINPGKAAEMNFSACIIKPILMSEIARIVRRVLDD